ncbi:MAG: hypothetical protein LRY71_13220 [Bacillaceae bacterium]|nr:hypothetical protein [Bacillaceae bacterium]
MRDQVQREPNVQRAIEQVRNEVVNNLRIDREVAREVERAVDEARALTQTGRGEQGRERIVQALRTAEQELARTEQRLESRPTQEVRVSEAEHTLEQPRQQSLANESLKPSELLKQMQTNFQKEGVFQKAVEEVTRQLTEAPFEKDVIEKIEHSIDKATQLKEQGRELAARQEVQQSFSEVEQQVAKTDPVSQPEVEQYLMNETFQTQQLTSKNYIVQTVTEKLAQAQAEFKTLQREITRNLDNIQRLTDTFKSQAKQHVKPLLETTIKKTR